MILIIALWWILIFSAIVILGLTVNENVDRIHEDLCNQWGEIDDISKSLYNIICLLEKKTEDNKISIAAFDQVLWERDVAVDQLKQLGYGFGEKPRTGRWVDNTNGTFTCDQCGCKHSKSNYCPNCGIKMMEG